jgi:hypothetical protein
MATASLTPPAVSGDRVPGEQLVHRRFSHPDDLGARPVPGDDVDDDLHEA